MAYSTPQFSATSFSFPNFQLQSTSDTPDAPDFDGYLKDFLPKNLEKYSRITDDMMGNVTGATKDAMQQYQQRMNDMVNIFNQYGGSLSNARDATLAGLQEAEDYYHGVSGNALQNYRGTLDELGQSVLSGEVPEQYKGYLDQLRQNQYEEIQKQLQQATGNMSRDVIQRLGAKGMMDSTRASNTLQGIQRSQMSTLEDAARNIENLYLRALLEQPYKAYQTIQPAEYNFLNTVLQNAGNIAGMKRGTAGSQFESARSMYDDLMRGAGSLSEMPLRYQDIANIGAQLPLQVQEGYLASVVNMWRDMLEAQLKNKEIDVQAKLQNKQIDEAYDDSFDFGDFLGALI